MSRSNRLCVVAVRGFLIGVILLTGGVSFSAEQTQKPAVDANQSQETAQDEGTTQLFFVPGDKQQSSASSKAADYKADYYAKSDLDAQERMAAEAKRLTELTDTQLSIVAIQTALLFLTVIFAAWAAIAASQAARAAHLTVDFIRKAERPFFVVKEIKPGEFGKAIDAFEALGSRSSKSDRWGVVVAATVNNVGTRPGIIRSVHFDYCCQPPPEKQPEIETFGEWAGKQTIAPSKNSPDIVGAFVFRADFIRGFIEYNEHLCVHGFVRYSDVHGTTWRSGFSFEYLTPQMCGKKEGMFVRSSPTSYWYDIEENGRENQPQSLWRRVLGAFAT